MKKVSKKIHNTILPIGMAALFCTFLLVFSTTAFCSTEYVTSGGFEDGNLNSWQTWGSGTVSVTTTQALTGTYAASINGEGSISQHITGLSANSTYYFVGYGKVGTSAGAYFGVKNYGGTEKCILVNKTTYQKALMSFKTGATDTSADIYFYNAVTGTAFADDISIQLCSTEYVTSGGFENGNLNSWQTWGSGTMSVTTTQALTGTYAASINGEGSISQHITGLSANTKYYFVSYGKLGTSTAAYFGVKNYGGTEICALVNTTSYKKYVIIFKTGATDTSADIYFYNVTGIGTTFADDISVQIPPSTAPLSDPNNSSNWLVNNNYTDEFTTDTFDTNKWYNYCSYWGGRQPSQFDPGNVVVSNGELQLKTISYNLIANSSFETGNLTGWSMWGAGTKTVVTDKKYGQYACKVNGEGAIEQTINNLTPNTTYRLTGWLKIGTGGSSVSLGVKNYGGSETSSVVTSTVYSNPSIEFTTGSSNTSAVIYVYNIGNVGIIYADDIALTKKTISTGLTFVNDNYIASACLQSKTKAPRGYYEVRAKMADATHTSSFWLQGTSTEIDVFESQMNNTITSSMDTLMLMNTHYFPGGWANDTADPASYDTNLSLKSDYHIYGVEWDSSNIKWFFDGQLVRTKQHTTHQENEYLFLDTEIFDWNGLPSNDLNSTFSVDYIRAWTKE